MTKKTVTPAPAPVSVAPVAPVAPVETLLDNAAHTIAEGFARDAAVNFATSEALSSEASAQLRNALGTIEGGKLTASFNEFEPCRVAFIGAWKNETSKTVEAAQKAFERLFFIAYGFKLSEAKPKSESTKAIAVATQRTEKAAAIELVAKSEETNKALEAAAKKAAKAVTDLKVKAIKADKADKPELQKQVAIMENIVKVNEAAIVARLKAEQAKLVEQCRELKATITEHIAVAMKAGDIDRLKKMATI